MNKAICALLLNWMVLGIAITIAAPNKGEQEAMNHRMKITIGEKTFAATLEDNAAAKAFKALLPLNLKMKDLNDNEKVIRLSDPLPTNDSNLGHIQNGDLMIWSANNLVLFYKSFPTAYHYTRLGRIDKPEGLAEAVGPEDVTIKFELK